MEKIRIGQIGIGHNHGSAKMAAVRKYPDLFEVTGVCEPDPEWVKKRGGWKEYADLPFLSEEALLAECDAVLVESDVWNLTATARRCIEAGKHIHMDKPGSGTLAEFREMLDMAEARGLTVQLGYMYRYNPAVRWCRELVRSGALGEIFSVNAEMSTFHGTSYKQWLTNFEGGIMYILGSHLVDLVVDLLGEPQRVTSYLKHTRLDGIDFADNDLAVLEYEKALARIFVSSVEVNGWGRRGLMVSGSRGTVNIMPIENRIRATYSDLSVADDCYEDRKIDVPFEDVPKDQRYDEMMLDFYGIIRKKKDNPFSFAHEYTVQKVLYEVIGKKEE